MPAPQPANEWEEACEEVEEEWNAWGHNACGFLKSHARGAVYPIPDLKIDATKFNAQIRFMIQLYFCVSKFVNFYPTFARSNAARTRPVFPPTNGIGPQAQEGQEWPPLTETERLRLQRGLLRYEMVCRLIGIPSVAASCNRDVFDVTFTNQGSSFAHHTWVLSPFYEMLPIDEVEEVVCAFIYVKDLYDSLRWKSFEEFHNHVLGLSQNRGDGLLDKDGSDARKTAGHWLSHNENQVLHSSSLELYRTFDWKESMSRLGLVFLDRVARSTLAERRELMRSVFNKLLRPGDANYLWRHWDDIVYEPSMAERRSRGVGPHCNSLIQTSSSGCAIAETIHIYGGDHRLRRLGWVFFDDKSKLRSLGLPSHAGYLAMRDWLSKAENRGPNLSLIKPKMPDSALAARFTEREWKEVVMEKYSTKDRCDDYQAMSQFVTGARAVVDFTSTQLPHLD